MNMQDSNLHNSACECAGVQCFRLKVQLWLLPRWIFISENMQTVYVQGAGDMPVIKSVAEKWKALVKKFMNIHLQISITIHKIMPGSALNKTKDSWKGCVVHTQHCKGDGHSTIKLRTSCIYRHQYS